MENGNLSHPDLDDQNKFILGPDYVDDGEGVRDLRGHGALVTGIVSAETDNNEGISGIAGSCKTLIIQVSNMYGQILHEDFRDGVIYAVDYGAKIINYSSGGDSSSTKEQAVQYAYEHNVIIVAASGNAGSSIDFPAAYSANYNNVIAVGATDHNDIRSGYSNYGSELNVVAPGGYGYPFTEDDIFSTVPNYPFFLETLYPEDPHEIGYAYMDGTSMATPHVAGVAALNLSIKNDLLPSTNRDIIQQTADDKGTTGKDDYYGYGRINAYQSTLLTLAYTNKSTSAGATQTNNARHLAKDDGYLYEVFYSGGEIFFRRSNDNGSTWQVTKRLSEGNGAYSRPALTTYYDNSIHVVWQRNLGNRTWDIYYTNSSDHGSSWLTPSTIAQNVNTSYYQNWGAQPVIAYCFVDEMDMQLMTVYTGSNGICYSTKTWGGASWSTPVNISGSWNNRIRFPSLTGKDGYFALLYDTRSLGIYSRAYNGSWSSEARVDWEGYYDRETCIAQEKNGGDMLATWAARQTVSSPYSVYFRRGYYNNTWSNFKNEFSDDVTFKDYRRPSITYFDSDYPNEYGVSLVFHSSDDRIIMKKYYDLFGSWYENQIASNGREASITGYAFDAPKYCWTDVSANPYEVKLSSSFLPKSSKTTEYKNVFARRAVVSNIKDQTSQCLQISNYQIKTKSGESFSIAFQSYPDDTVKLSLTTVWNYMDSEPVKLPEDAEELVYTKKVYTTLPDDSSKKKYETSFTDVSYQLTIADAKTKSALAVLDESAKSGECIIDVSPYAGKEIILYPSLKIEGVFEEALYYCLVNIFGAKNIETEKLPSLAQNTVSSFVKVYDLSLKQNYPNPFNPVTDIRFSIPQEGLAALSVYDLQGRLVKTLFNGFREAGEFSASWNGTNAAGQNVASGLYFYRLTLRQAQGDKQILTGKMFLVR